jgi:glycine dehydrogenase subunit 1
MPYLANTPEDERAMLAAIGVASIDELFAMVPADLRLNRALRLPPALTELELTRHMKVLADANTPAGQVPCFLGGGSYDHFIPAVVDAIASRGEFFTSYTPYQPEASQGNLQVFFEYQTLVTRLTGMDVSNASLYEGATAATEAVLMSLAATGRKRVVTFDCVHPEYRQTLATYLRDLDAELVTLPSRDGGIDLALLEKSLDSHVAAVLIQQPNFFGTIEEGASIAKLAHEAGAVMVVVADPLSLGVLSRPGDYGADIVAAEGQSLGNPLAFGGPYLGILACREQFIRRMPGRITGETVDRDGRRCFVLTLQTREQHIRREKATSNICTNQGLLALRATIYLAAMGPAGLREAGELCVQKSHYALDRVTRDQQFAPAFKKPFFKEFVVRSRDRDVEAMIDDAADSGVFAGVPLGRWYPELSDCFLVAVTEKRSREEIDRWAELLNSIAKTAEPAHA